MKTCIWHLIAFASFGFLVGCTTVEQREPARRTTTTEQTTVTRPLSNSVETRTIRAY